MAGEVLQRLRGEGGEHETGGAVWPRLLLVQSGAEPLGRGIERVDVTTVLRLRICQTRLDALEIENAEGHEHL